MPTLGQKLMKATLANNLEEVKKLLEKGASPDEVVKEQVPLSWAIYHGYDKIAGLLLEKSKDLNRGNTYPDAGGPLHSAVAAGKAELVKKMLDKGADPNYRGGIWGRTPLHTVAEKGSAKIAQQLVDAGGNPNLEDKYDSATPLSYAIGYSNAKVLEVFAKNNPKLKQNFPKSDIAPLHLAALRSPAIIKILLNNGAPIEMKDKKGWTALHHAAKADNAAAIKFLLKCGANPKAKTSGDETPYEIAEANHATKAMKLL